MLDHVFNLLINAVLSHSYLVIAPEYSLLPSLVTDAQLISVRFSWGLCVCVSRQLIEKQLLY